VIYITRFLLPKRYTADEADECINSRARGLASFRGSMQAQLYHQSSQSAATAVSAVVEQIFSARRITRADQNRLMNVLLSKDAISIEDQNEINRVFDALRRGLLRVVD
jgi:hypothetical protein